jgi:hypothetical protein
MNSLISSFLNKIERVAIDLLSKTQLKVQSIAIKKQEFFKITVVNNWINVSNSVAPLIEHRLCHELLQQKFD